MVPKRNWGRRGMPEDYLAILVADYRRLNSTRKVAALHGRSGECIHEILARLGLTNPKKKKTDFVDYKGERFTADSHGYLRSTRAQTRKPGCHRLLHRVIWEEANGPIPSGHQVLFKDGNSRNCALENLRCLSLQDCLRDEARPHHNAWSVYWARKAELLAEFERVIDTTVDAEAWQKAREAFEALLPPQTPEASRCGQRAKSQALWASYTAEERAARVQRSADAKRRRKMERLAA